MGLTLCILHRKMPNFRSNLLHPSSVYPAMCGMRFRRSLIPLNRLRKELSSYSMLCQTKIQHNILSRVLVIMNGVWIRNWIY
jgi:hypothetical protein